MNQLSKKEFLFFMYIKLLFSFSFIDLFDLMIYLVDSVYFGAPSLHY